MIDEPTLNETDIQGHLATGFGTLHSLFLGIKLIEVNQARAFLLSEVDNVTTLSKTQEKRSERRAAFAAGQERPIFNEVMMAIGLSAIGLRKLGVTLEANLDQNFVNGMAADAATLGDTTDTSGNPQKWVIGDTPENTPDVFIILAGEVEAKLHQAADALLDKLGNTVDLIYDQPAYRRRDNKEHFGFNDGISQPGLRGRLSDGTFLARRLLPEDDPRHEILAQPGKPLIWPGQFIFGYPSQNENPRIPGAERPFPQWLRNGSFLVFRRLRQDVEMFRSAFDKLAKNLSNSGLTADMLMAKAVGRWPDGTPLAVSPDTPDPHLAGDIFRNNYFSFSAPQADIEVTDNGESRTIPGTKSDLFGFRCPAIAHIRKINPRDDITDIGTEDTLSKMILRRGMLFGADFETEPEAERGLLFLSYQTSIDLQFVFLQKNWANSVKRPSSSGHDMIIGKSSLPNGERQGRLPLPSKEFEFKLNGNWVETSGGGYFAVPGIAGLRFIFSDRGL
ncbi:Dyp-type peroxidase [Microcoleus sp. D2_18a_B4]|uniref:Dyp-type peroxidase n=1 Tax=Microcoleus sp. D2_18a_B4 TaxID=3055329 RepID=UPI002FD6CACA